MAVKREVSSSFETQRQQTPVQMNSQKVKSPKGAPWALIIFFMFFFFPVGIVLMLSKLHKEKDNCIGNGKGTAAVGWVFFGLGIFYVLIGFTGGLETEDGASVVSGVIFMTALCCGGGYALVRHGNKYKKLGSAYMRYSAIIAGTPNGSVDLIASACQTPVNDVCEELQKMINLGFFPSCYIDLNKKIFVSPYLRENTPVVHSEDEKPKVVKCPNCGAVNTVRDGISQCEYCGTPLVKQ